MNVLWEHDRCTAREVLNSIADSTWAYTTVKTLLSRLVDKGALREEKQGNTSVYEAAVTRSRARGNALRALLDRAFDGAFAPLMAHLADHEKLSTKDRQRLQEILEQEEEA